MLADPRDAILYAACPLVMAPTFASFAPLDAPGKRLVAAADGLYLEAKSPALHWLLRLNATPMPYGRVTPFLRLTNGPIRRAMLLRITDQAMAASPNEIAFGIEADGPGYRLTVPDTHSASPGHVSYQDAFHPDHLVLDVHSHGEGSAYFSGTDDASDLSRAGPYLAGVIAPRKDYASTRLVFRAVAAPYLIELAADDALLLGVFA